MTHEERTSAIGTWLRVDVLPRYNMPDHLGDTQARREISDMVEDINRVLPILPADSFTTFLADVFSKIRMTHTSRAWPPISTFVKAVTGAKKEAPTRIGRQAEYVTDEYAVAAAKMRSGETVGDGFIYGPKAKEIVARGLASEADMDGYRSALFFNFRDVYGEDCAKRKEAELRDFHAASVRPTSDADLAEVRADRDAPRFRRMDRVEA